MRDIDTIREEINMLIEEGLNLYKLHGTKPRVAKKIDKLNDKVKEAIDNIKEDADILYNINTTWNSIGNPINYNSKKIDEHLNRLEKAYVNIAKSVPALAKIIKQYQAEVNKLQDLIENDDN